MRQNSIHHPLGMRLILLLFLLLFLWQFTKRTINLVNLHKSLSQNLCTFK